MGSIFNVNDTVDELKTALENKYEDLENEIKEEYGKVRTWVMKHAYVVITVSFVVGVVVGLIL
jgi:ElaB/YqjD/DUF883 family membrane-anchored ribosome-binding protein